MKYILSFVFALVLFSCTNQQSTEPESSPLGLFAPGDTVNVSYDASTGKLVATSDKEEQVIKVGLANGDSFVTVIKPVEKTFVYYVPSIDTYTIKKPSGPIVNPPKDTTTTPPPSTGTRSNLVFSALFNGSNPFPSGDLYKQACCSYSVTQSKSVVREGDGSFRLESRGTDASVSGGYRPEFIPPTNTRLKDGWYGYSVYMENWSACNSCGEHIMQWHPENGTGSAALAVYTNNNTFHIRLNPEGDATAFTVKDGMKIISNKWYDFVWHVVWSSDKTKGRVECWIDGVKYADYTGATLTGGGTPYFKCGINRWNIQGVNRIMHVDALRIGNASATYKDVAP